MSKVTQSTFKFLPHQCPLPPLFPAWSPKSSAPWFVCRCFGNVLAAPPYFINSCKAFEGGGIRESRIYLSSRHAWIVKWMQCIFLPISSSLCFLLLYHLFQRATTIHHMHMHAPVDTCVLPKQLWTYTSCILYSSRVMNWRGLASTVAGPQ